MLMPLADSILATFLTLGFRILQTFESICYFFDTYAINLWVYPGKTVDLSGFRCLFLRNCFEILGNRVLIVSIKPDFNQN